jgi:prolipoprotein diacylglyceryltransferase
MRKYMNLFDGAAAMGYLVLYGAFRFVVEFFRADNVPTALGFGVLSNQQVFALGMILVGVVLFIGLWRYRPAASDPPGDAAPKD